MLPELSRRREDVFLSLVALSRPVSFIFLSGLSVEGGRNPTNLCNSGCLRLCLDPPTTHPFLFFAQSFGHAFLSCSVICWRLPRIEREPDSESWPTRPTDIKQQCEHLSSKNDRLVSRDRRLHPSHHKIQVRGQDRPCSNPSTHDHRLVRILHDLRVRCRRQISQFALFSLKFRGCPPISHPRMLPDLRCLPISQG